MEDLSRYADRLVLNKEALTLLATGLARVLQAI
jgi:hypothetical protein